MLRQYLLAGLLDAFTGTSVWAQRKAPAPEFAVEMSFQERVARFLSTDCATLEFDHAGFDRHMLALMAAYSDRGHSTRRIGALFAPVRPGRFDPYFASFFEKNDLMPESPVADFCAAGVAEVEWRTPIGQILKVMAQ